MTFAKNEMPLFKNKLSSINPLAPDLDEILIDTRDFWDEIKNERIFISGGTGFFGCWLLETFAWAIKRLKINTKATILTRSPEYFKNKAPHLFSHNSFFYLKGNILDFNFPPGEFRFIIHAAADTNSFLYQTQPLLMLNSIVKGTNRILDFSIESNTKKFLFISSGAVYGPQPQNISHITEDYIGAPDSQKLSSTYGIGKKMGEHLCLQYNHKFGIETKIARCFAFVGPYLPLNTHFAIGNFLQDSLLGRTIEVKGDGTPFRSYLYSSDLVIWLLTILFKGQPCSPYNVGSENSISIKELAQIISQLSPTPANIQINELPQHVSEIQRYIPSTLKARTELGLHELNNLERAIKKTIDWNINRKLGS